MHCPDYLQTQFLEMEPGFRLRVSVCFMVLAAICPSRGAAQEAGQEHQQLARQAKALLKKHCYRCHGADFQVPRLDVLNRQRLVSKRVEERTYVVPGDPDSSELWNRVGIQQDMPPEDVEIRPSEEEREVIREWIEVGAPEATDPSREFIPGQFVLEKIRDHLKTRKADTERRHLRFLTLTHLHNNPNVSASDLRMYRAAFSKLINSVSRSAKLVIPELLDPIEVESGAGVIFCIDLRDLGWEKSDWQSAIQSYPYGVRWAATEHPVKSRFDQEINHMLGGDISGDGVSTIRVDWFIHTAARPPAYHNLLRIPETLRELEERVGVNIENDFKNDRLMRAGFAGSGVSRHNRLIDRHDGANTMYYYQSYDFGRSFGRGVLSRFPLGPKFEGNEFNDFAFDNDGGEVVFSMPNGMQGYMLIDKEGFRLDDAPIAIVRDINESSGSPVVVNGISCIGCHRRGLLDYEDSTRAARALSGDALGKLASLVPANDEIQQVVNDDRQLFISKLRQVTSPFLLEGEDYGDDLPIKRIEDLPEPVSTVCRWYDKDVGAAEAAAELNMRPSDNFLAAVRFNNKIRQLGAGPLGDNARIPRRMWDTQDESTSSVFQRVFVALEFGTAVSPISQ